MSSDTRSAIQSGPALEIWLATRLDTAFNVAMLTQDEQSRYRRLRSLRKRKEYELSRTLLRRLGPTTKAFSLSHSGGLVAVALDRSGRAFGIDLELHKDRDVISLARFAFHAEEAAALAQHPNALQLFYDLWVLKEACAKALGLNLVDALRECVFRIEDGIVGGRLPTRAAWRAYVWRARPDLSLGAVVLGSEQPFSVRHIEWPQESAASWLETATAAGGGATRL
jgi:phosphopantetheinyl transferase